MRVLGMGWVLVVAVAGGSCRTGPANQVVVDDLNDAAHASLAACATGDVAAHLQIVRDLRDSYHEMIVCGGLAANFNDSVASVVANAALDRARGGKGFTYQGDGVYVAGNGMMMIRATAARDVGGLVKGDPIVADILDPDSYLVGITVDATGALGVVAGGGGGGGAADLLLKAATKLEFRFTARGPLFDLLGLGDDEVAAGRLSIDASRLERALGDSIMLANRVSVKDELNGTTIHYLLDGQPRTVRETREKKKVPMELSTIVATRAATGQTVKITEWTMDFRADSSKGTMDGTIGMDIDGGAFPYHVVFTYPHRKDPDVRLTCR